MPHWLTRAAGAILAVAVTSGLVLLGASPVAAHSSLASSSPGDGERFETAPTEVELVFATDVLTIGAVVLVVDESGRDWVSGEAVIDGSNVVVPLSEGMPDAGYQVRWRVVSADGHPISSIIPFAVGDAEPLTGSISTDTGSASEEAPEVEAQGEGTGNDPVVHVLLIGLVGAVTAGALFVIIRFIYRRRRAAVDARTS